MFGRNAGKYPVKPGGVEAVHLRKQPAKYGAVFIEDGVVPILKQGSLLDLDLVSRNATAVNAAAEHPVHAAVAVVGAAVAVFAEGAPEFADDDHDRIPPRCAYLVGESGQAATKLLQTPGEVTARAAFSDVRVPTTHVHETDVELILHDLRDASRFEFESFGGYGIAARRFHFGRHFLHDFIAHLETFTDLRAERRVLVHRGDIGALTRIDPGLAKRPQRHIRNLRVSAQDDRQLIGERNSTRAGQNADEPVEKSGSVVAAAVERLPKLDAVLGLEVAAREIIGPGERDECGLAFLIQRKEAVAQ